MNCSLTRASLLFTLLLSTSACLPVTSKSPVGSTAGYKPDPQLTGLWKAKSESSSGYLSFYPQPDGSMKVVLLVPATAGDKGAWSVFDVHTATLGADHFMDVSEIEDAGKPPEPKLEHMPILYRFEADGSLVLTMMDEDAARDAIRGGRIAGTIEAGKYGDVVLTATPAALDAFLRTPAGHALFLKPMEPLTRVE